MQRRKASGLAIDPASRSVSLRRRAAFTLLETLIVLVLLLALAAIAIPAAADWFASRSDDQVRENIASIIRDQQLESIVSRTPRVVWVGLVAAPLDHSSGGEREAATRAARWGIGADVLSSGARQDASSPSEKRRRPVLELPSGWIFDLAPDRSRSVAEATPDANAVEQPAETDSANAEMIVLWPHGQIDQPRTLVLVDPSGVSWRLSLNPWTGTAAWNAESPAKSPADSRGESASPAASEEP